MSQRYEVDDVNCELKLLTPNDDPGEYHLDLDDGDYALVIGNPWASAFAIEGSPDDLRAFAQRVQEFVKRSLPEPASQNHTDRLADWPRGRWRCLGVTARPCSHPTGARRPASAAPPTEQEFHRP